MVRAKFTVTSITRSMGSKQVDGKWVPAEMQTINLTPVYGNGDPNHENTKFWQASPSGSLQLGCINLDAARQFEIGKEFSTSTSRQPSEALLHRGDALAQAFA